LNRFEEEARAGGFRIIAGIDEAGRGPLAGPVAAAAVIFENAQPVRGIRDSKKLSPSRREALAQEIKEHALEYAVCFVEPSVIDEINILQASLLAMTRAVGSLRVNPDYLLIDGTFPLRDVTIPQKAVIRGDSLSYSIAAASILAKVARDAVMLEMDKCYPGYGFAAHKGYGTAEHLEALRRRGPCPIHRLSFRPVFECLRKKDSTAEAVGSTGFGKGAGLFFRGE
jgi:ribonuclease HII